MRETKFTPTIQVSFVPLQKRQLPTETLYTHGRLAKRDPEKLVSNERVRHKHAEEWLLQKEQTFRLIRSWWPCKDEIVESGALHHS